MNLYEATQLFPRYQIWLDLAGYHARYANEPKGSPAKYSASTVEGLAELIRTGAPELPKRVPSLPERIQRCEPADPEILARVLAALRRTRQSLTPSPLIYWSLQ